MRGRGCTLNYEMQIMTTGVRGERERGDQSVIGVIDNLSIQMNQRLGLCIAGNKENIHLEGYTTRCI